MVVVSKNKVDIKTQGETKKADDSIEEHDNLPNLESLNYNQYDDGAPPMPNQVQINMKNNV